MAKTSVLENLHAQSKTNAPSARPKEKPSHSASCTCRLSKDLPITPETPFQYIQILPGIETPSFCCRRWDQQVKRFYEEPKAFSDPLFRSVPKDNTPSQRGYPSILRSPSRKTCAVRRVAVETNADETKPKSKVEIPEAQSNCRKHTACGGSKCCSRNNRVRAFHEDAKSFCILSRMPMYLLRFTRHSRFHSIFQPLWGLLHIEIGLDLNGHPHTTRVVLIAEPLSQLLTAVFDD
jgi:hypothetical protein